MNKEQDKLIGAFLKGISSIVGNRLVQKYNWSITDEVDYSCELFECLKYALEDRIDFIKLTDNRLKLIDVEIVRLNKEKAGLLALK